MANDAFSNYTENNIVDHQFRSATWAKPSALHFGLLATVSNDGVTLTELSGGTYARVAKTPGATDFTVTGKTAANATGIAFAAMGISATATHMGIWDAASGGNLLAWSLLANSKVLGVNDPGPTFAVGVFTFTHNGTSDALSNKILNHMFGATTWAKPTNIQIAYYTTAPTAAGGGTEVSAVNTNYSRASIAPSDANFTATQGGNTGASSGTGGATSNSVVGTFPAPNGSANWGAINSMGLYDNTGLFIGWTTFPAVNVNVGDIASTIGVGAMTWTVN